MIFNFNVRYFTLAGILFITEVFIGACLHDSIIRPYGGDFLIVIFLYCLFKGFVKASIKGTAIGVLLLAYAIEVSQYYHFVEVIGLDNSPIARLVLGDYFAWVDMLAYTLGIALVLVLEQLRINRSINNAYTN